MGHKELLKLWCSSGSVWCSGWALSARSRRASSSPSVEVFLISSSSAFDRRIASCIWSVAFIRPKDKLRFLPRLCFNTLSAGQRPSRRLQGPDFKLGHTLILNDARAYSCKKPGKKSRTKQKEKSIPALCAVVYCPRFTSFLFSFGRVQSLRLLLYAHLRN